MVKRRDPARERFWRELLRRREASGLTTRDFCEQEGVSENSFYAWRRELATRDRESIHGGFVPVQVSASREPAGGVFELTLPNGYLLRMPVNIESNRLREILEAIDDGED